MRWRFRLSLTLRDERWLMTNYVILLTSLLSVVAAPVQGAEKSPREFRVWATSCAHVPADIRRGRESLAHVIRQSEGLIEGAPAFDWDIMIDAGDLSAHQQPPGDRDGKELIRQYRAMTKHRREQIYNVPGNHDAPYYDQGPGSWFQKWGDPLGRHTEYSGVDPKRRPFPVEGNWERYRFVAGNILFLMLADRNDAPEPVGRGHSKDAKSGGYPAGAVTRETFNWWKQQVLDNQDKIIVTMHHHALRDTTTASGRGEGNPRYHGSSGGAEGSSYLYYLIENDDPEDFRYKKDAHVFEDFLDSFHKEHGRGAIDLWIAGHTHVKGPDDNWGDKTITERRWGVSFLQVAALTRHHGGSHPLSRLLTFTGGSNEVTTRVYLHDGSYEKNPVGWYARATNKLTLRHKCVAPPPIKPLSPFPKAAKVFDEPYARRNTSKATRPLQKTNPSPDLSTRWKKTGAGSLHLEALLQEDSDNQIDSKPLLVNKSPADGDRSASFDGTQRLFVGQIAMDDWTDLTVSAWINTSKLTAGMRIVSKDQIGTPGTFMLWHDLKSSWSMQVWDDRAKQWQTASWHSHAVNDGKWHLLTGVVESKHRKVLLYVDGVLKAETPWTAKTLDDSDKNDLVVGADSGRQQFGHAFHGLIYDVHLDPQALTAEQITLMFQRQQRKASAQEKVTTTIEDTIKVVTERNVAVPMRDGVVLRANVFRPDRGGPYPVLVVRTPYGKANGGMDRYVKAGYIVVAQDARGRYASDGKWESFLRFKTHDGEDGFDTVEWAAKLPDSSGKVGTFGASYNAFLQWRLAALRPPSLVAMAAYSIPARYNDLEGPGTIRPGRRLHWWVTSMSPNMRLKAGRNGVNTKTAMRKLWTGGESEKWLNHLPWLKLPQNACEDETEAVRYWLKNPHTDPWKLHEDVKHIEVPNLNLVGWHDHCNGNLLLDRTIMSEAATATARNGSRTVIGPWAHSRRRRYQNIDFGPDAQLANVDLEIRWFDYWLKGKQNGINKTSPWRLFVMGDNRWRNEREWPLKRTQQKSLYFTSTKGANTPAGDGRLEWQKPTALGTDLYTYDPKNPVPSLHGPGLQTSTTDQRPLANRQDVLVYQSEPLTERLEVTGNATVELFAASSAPDTDFFARLIDVAPDGMARDVSLGMVRARYRDGLEQPALIEPGDVVKYTITMNPTSNAFLPGHRIRLDVTSSDFPNYDRNHNTPADQNSDGELRTAKQTVYHGGIQATRIILPWIPNAPTKSQEPKTP